MKRLVLLSLLASTVSVELHASGFRPNDTVEEIYATAKNSITIASVYNPTAVDSASAQVKPSTLDLTTPEWEKAIELEVDYFVRKFIRISIESRKELPLIRRGNI